MTPDPYEGNKPIRMILCGLDGEPLVSFTSDKPSYSVQVDEDGNYIYIGKAEPGSATADAVWRIVRLDFTNDPDVVTLFADGNDNFDNIWNNRASLTYS